MTSFFAVISLEEVVGKLSDAEKRDDLRRQVEETGHEDAVRRYAKSWSRAERGFDVSYETIRCWTRKFGRLFGRNLRRTRPGPTGCWHLDEMVVRIGGQKMFLWRAVDDEGEVLDMLVQKRRNKRAALIAQKTA